MLSLIALAASSVQLLGGRAGVLVFDSKIALRPIQPGTMLRSSAIRGWGDDAVLRDGTFRKCCKSDSLTHWKRLGWRLAAVNGRLVGGLDEIEDVRNGARADGADLMLWHFARADEEEES